MRVALGTVEVNEDDRRAIAFYYGQNSLASHETVRAFVLANGYPTSLDDVRYTYEQNHGTAS